MIAPEEVVERFHLRRQARGRLIEAATLIRDHYEADYSVPLPELDRNEQVAVANLLAQGIDHHGMRIASTTPNLVVPPVRPGIRTSEERARKRRAAVAGWWESSELEIKQARRARWLVAYSCAPVVIVPDRKRRVPAWRTRDPLATFPADRPDPDDMCPPDVIFAYMRTRRWIEQRYGYMPYPRERRDPDERIFVLEYRDADETVMVAHGSIGPDGAGPADYQAPPSWFGPEDRLWGAVLERSENRAGVCTAVVPGRVTLDRPKGQFDDLVGLFQQQARLMALEVNAVARSVFPDTWMVGRPNEAPKIITKADGLGGVVGEVQGGDIKEMQSTPGFMTYPTIDRLERAQRLAGGIPAEFGGEAASNVRTGRRGDSILSATVDFPVAEAQRVLARSLTHETQRAIAVDKAYFGGERKSFYVSFKGSKGRLDYEPTETFEDDTILVSYAAPGTDANSLVIGLGQRVGVGLMSKRSAAEIDPMVDDAEAEHDRVVTEGLEQALLTAVQTRASNGELPEADVARIMELVGSGKVELAEAVQQVQRETQERQAAQAPPGSPEVQPGLANPGAGAEAGAAIPPPEPSVTNLASLLGQLRRPAMALEQERTPV